MSKIQVEFKDKKFTVVYGKLSASAATVKEAIDALVQKFRDEMERFFLR